MKVDLGLQGSRPVERANVSVEVAAHQVHQVLELQVLAAAVAAVLQSLLLVVAHSLETEVHEALVHEAEAVHGRGTKVHTAAKVLVLLQKTAVHLSLDLHFQTDQVRPLATAADRIQVRDTRTEVV